MTETRIVFFPAHGVIVEAQQNFRSLYFVTDSSTVG
jgi:hypothetical protein